MKKLQLLAGVLSASVLLSGCSALLDRDYVSVTPHSTTPAVDGNPSILRAESYQELVNALIYLINQGKENGAIRLYEDAAAENALEEACLEVVQESPIGAYAVEYIKYSTSSVVSYKEASVQITYRRTREQMSSIVSATGTTAIRNELTNALLSSSPELVLHISNFDGSEESIRTLCRQTYLDTPSLALEMPKLDVSIYPDAGQQRIVEIQLTYALDAAEREHRQAQLRSTTKSICAPMERLNGSAQLKAAAKALWDIDRTLPQGGSTAYDALVTGSADSQGLSLAMALLCQELELKCVVVDGQQNGLPHVWTVVSTDDGWRHLDLAHTDDPAPAFRTDEDLEALGYLWNRENVPVCGSSAPRR